MLYSKFPLSYALSSGNKKHAEFGNRPKTITLESLVPGFFCIQLIIYNNRFLSLLAATTTELTEAMTFSTIYGKRSPALTNSKHEILIRDQQRLPLYR